MKHFIAGNVVAVDTETTGLDVWTGDRPFAFSFTNRQMKSAYFEFPVNPFTRRVMYEKRLKSFNRIRRFMSDERITKIFFNAKFDIRMCEHAGIETKGRVEDAAFASRISGVPRHLWKLKPLCKHYFDMSDEDQALLHSAVGSLRGQAKKFRWKVSNEVEPDYWLTQYAVPLMREGIQKRKQFSRPDVARAIERGKRMKKLVRKYACNDTERTIAAWEFFKRQLRELDMWHLYEEEMYELWPVTYAMESHGLYIHRKTAQRCRAETMKKLKRARRTIKRELPKDFNPNSHKQKVEQFVEKRGLEPLRHTPAGNPQMDRMFFEHYEKKDEVIGALIEQSKCNKAIGTYHDYYLTAADEHGIIHPDLNQIGTKTGRYSGRFQTVPKRAPKGDVMLEVRRPFRPRPGHVWYLADYAQIEARIWADEFDEQNMLQAFEENRDPYDELTEQILSITKYELRRRESKDIFLGKLYGLGRQKLIWKLMEARHGEDVDDEWADDIIVAFDTAVPKVQESMEQTKKLARAQGYVENRYGQRVYIEGDKYYTGVNYLIQPSAARLMKRAMIRCHRYLQEIGYGRLLLTIHDELVFEFPLNKRPIRVLRTLKELMEDSEDVFRVKTPVDIEKVTHSWLERRPCKWALST